MRGRDLDGRGLREGGAYERMGLWEGGACERMGPVRGRGL